jgi:hypothetical protein
MGVLWQKISQVFRWDDLIICPFFRLIVHSTCLEEIDLDKNLIGDLGGREVMMGLEIRKEGEIVTSTKNFMPHHIPVMKKCVGLRT